ncbi:Uma2 family endonuclease [Sphingomonas sp. PB2P19]|uniref:Uma2 family endonuclease n=1 Tax=Sphingomonas rhamnosi TaxID=3096156 RepID=UPI002FC6CEE7
MTIFQNIRNGLIPARLTVAEVYALQDAGVIDDRDRFELIDGEIVPMAAAKFSHHERMKSRLNEALVFTKPPEIGVFVEPSVSFSETTMLEPDLALWPRDIGSQDVRGTDLLLLIEVAVSSLGFDLRVKAGKYARHGVRDYWVVDAIRKTIRVHRAPVDGGYTDVEEYEAHDTVCALLLPDIAIRLDVIDGPPSKRP